MCRRTRHLSDSFGITHYLEVFRGQRDQRCRQKLSLLMFLYCDISSIRVLTRSEIMKSQSPFAPNKEIISKNYHLYVYLIYKFSILMSFKTRWLADISKSKLKKYPLVGCSLANCNMLHSWEVLDWKLEEKEREVCSLVGIRVSVGELVKPPVWKTGDLGSNPGQGTNFFSQNNNLYVYIQIFNINVI